jgi:ABC-type sugar transport system ATPase subunit
MMARATVAAISLPLKLVEPLGKDTLLYFDDGSERAFVAVSEGLALAEELDAGAQVSIDFDPRRLYFFDAATGRRIRTT